MSSNLFHYSTGEVLKLIFEIQTFARRTHCEKIFKNLVDSFPHGIEK
jgi:hypothetical protein